MAGFLLEKKSSEWFEDLQKVGIVVPFFEKNRFEAKGCFCMVFVAYMNGGEIVRFQGRRSNQIANSSLALSGFWTRKSSPGFLHQPHFPAALCQGASLLRTPVPA